MYAALLEALELDLSDEERDKPPCCDDEGHPPSDEHVAGLVSEAVDRLARRPRRR